MQETKSRTLRCVAGAEHLSCKICGTRAEIRGDPPQRMEYLASAAPPGLASCANPECPQYGLKFEWYLTPTSRMGLQKRHLGARTYDDRAILREVEQADRLADARESVHGTDPGTGYYADELGGIEEVRNGPCRDEARNQKK